MTRRKRYSKEFKREVIRRANENEQGGENIAQETKQEQTCSITSSAFTIEYADMDMSEISVLSATKTGY